MNCVPNLIKLTSLVWLILMAWAITAMAWVNKQLPETELILAILVLLSLFILYKAVHGLRHYSRLCLHQVNSANQDPLTEIGNRRAARHQIQHAINTYQRHHKMFGIIFIDMNRFKQVNDTYGHQVGDYVLKTTAERISSNIRAIDHAFRLGGDEFLILVNHIERRDDCSKVAIKLRSALTTPIDVDNHTVESSASVGCSIYPYDGEDIESIIEAADQRMYRQKSGKRTLTPV